MENLQRPPIGLVPKYIHDSQRFRDICDAISRYYNAGLEIPVKWIKEYNELVCSLFTKNKIKNNIMEAAEKTCSTGSVQKTGSLDMSDILEANRYKQSCRKESLLIAKEVVLKNVDYPDHNDVIKEADKYYEWLTNIERTK